MSCHHYTRHRFAGLSLLEEAIAPMATLALVQALVLPVQIVVWAAALAWVQV
jgi:hypothetical protein